MLHKGVKKIFFAISGLVAALVLAGVLMQTRPVEAAQSDNTYTEGEYSIRLADYSNVVSDEIKNRIVKTYFETYPAMVERYNKNATKHNFVEFDPNYDGAAYAGGGSIVFSANYIKNFPSETTVIIHETMHVVQSYPTYDYAWLVEGIAEYARYYYSPLSSGPIWTFGGFSTTHRYDGSYQETGRFLTWLTLNGYPKITEELDWRLRSRVFSEQSWVDITGKTVEMLWAEYTANPSLVTVRTNTANVTIYQDANFGGNSCSLSEGSYVLSDLNDLGFSNDDLSSIKIPFGYKVTLYWDNNFGGTSITYDETSTYVGNEWNDKMSSIKVEIDSPVVLYKHANYGGTAVALGLGTYNSGQLNDLGFANDDLSSIAIPQGYKVTLYWDNEFLGSKLLLTNSTGYVGNDWNDKMSSIVIEEASKDSTLPAYIAGKLSSTAAASGIETNDFPAIYAVDGNISTRFSSNYNDSANLTLDLGSTRSVSKVILNWEAAYGSAYQIQVSLNGNTWTTVYTTYNGAGGIEEIEFSRIEARYVRMQGISRALPYGYSLWEMEVYGQ